MTRSYSGGQNTNEQQYLQEEMDDEDRNNERNFRVETSVSSTC